MIKENESEKPDALLRPYCKYNNFILAHGDCFKLLPMFSHKFDMIFADPPYFLSNGGISLQSGKVVCVDKGEWDKGKTPEEMKEFNMEWLRLCRDKLKDNGTIWISGTYHNIFSVANCLTELGYKILNVITWQKTNPPVNISCRFFTYSTEFIIWARKCEKVAHKYNYELMKKLNNDKQMTDVWRLPAIGRWEKSCGKHPTQKPLSVLTRIILSCTDKGDWILDPFSGSSTTGIAACLCDRRFAGIEQSEEFCQMSKARREELDNMGVKADLKRHIVDFKTLESSGQFNLFDGDNGMVCEDVSCIYETLPFDTKPLVEQTEKKEMCFLTCYVRRIDEECEAFMTHQATTYTTTLKSKTKLAKATHLFPMVKGAVDGYYEILGSTIGEDKKVHFTLGKYTHLSDEWHNIYDKMRPWELLKEDECRELCKKR